MRRGYFDIETGGRNAYKAKVWVMSIIDDDADKPETVSLYHTQDENLLISQIIDCISQYDEIVSWNGIRFDVPFINTRSRLTGGMRFQHNMHVDLGMVVKERYGLRFWNMEAVAKSIGIEDTKSPFSESIWNAAGQGDPEAWSYIIDHCERDVKVLRSLYKTFMLGGYTEVDPDAIGPAAQE